MASSFSNTVLRTMARNDTVPMQSTNVTPIHKLLTPETIRVGLPGRSKEEVINRLIAVFEGHPAVQDLEGARKAVFDREYVMSTGVGKGLGLPHAKTSAVTDTLAAFAVTAEPVEFGAIDSQPVRLLFLLLGTEEAKSQHIKILSRVSRLMNRDQFREQLLEAGTPEEVLHLFEQGEMTLAGR